VTVEVDNTSVDHLLSAEVQILEAVGFQRAPQQALWARHRLTKFTRTYELLDVRPRPAHNIRHRLTLRQITLLRHETSACQPQSLHIARVVTPLAL
jgi:hypothetical protein